MSKLLVIGLMMASLFIGFVLGLACLDETEIKRSQMFDNKLLLSEPTPTPGGESERRWQEGYFKL
jgi:hypothetical protein